MQQRTRYRTLTLGLLSLGLLVGAALMASPAQAQTVSNGPYYATPSWDQTLPSATRFIVLSNFNSQAVLDRETGLVWEKAPQTTMNNWFGARSDCTGKKVGNRKGWRLPSVHELASLIELPLTSGLALPAGHPFTIVQPDFFYWSATTDVGNSTPPRAWVVFISNGIVDGSNIAGAIVSQVWCVRGGNNAEGY